MNAGTKSGGHETACCPRTRVRLDACVCSACARGKAADAKHQTNKRDARVLLGLIAGCIENHPSQQFERATWDRVGDVAYLRERLMEIAVGFALGPDGDERRARRRLEEALCTNDEEVADALIDAL